ncbi:hypothetical protein [Natrinema sp. HArc-T2]|uniref:hypothetical protein n=1 Tax=Natrinema sp. HArc-T2 TaxID=3242701 RepID=UPI00359E70C9
MDVFKDIRDDLCNLFEEAYEQHPYAQQQQYESMAVSNLKEDAKKRATVAYSYRPSNPVTQAKSLVSGLNEIFTTVLLVIAVVGSFFGFTFASYAARVGLELLQSAESVIISIALGGPSLLGLLALAFLLWLKALAVSPTIVETFNQELVIGPQEIVRTDDKAELVSVIVWNDSLIGPGAIRLVNTFSVFWILSVIPGLNPYRFVLFTIESHMDVFVEVDGYREAALVLFNRMRPSVE